MDSADEEKRLKEKIRALREKLSASDSGQSAPVQEKQSSAELSLARARLVDAKAAQESNAQSIAFEAASNSQIAIPLKPGAELTSSSAPFKAPPSQPTKIPPIAAGNAPKSVQAQRPVAASPVASSTPKEKKGFFASLFGSKKKSTPATAPVAGQVGQQKQVPPGTASAAPKPVSSPAPKQVTQVKDFSTSQELASKELAKAHETEVEAIVDDLMGKALQEAQVAATTPVGEKQPPVHRRYLLRRQEMQAQQQAKSAQGQAVRTQQQAQQQEYTEMVSEVYTQYKALEPAQPKKPEAPKEEKKKDEKLSPRELRAKAKGDAKNAAPATGDKTLSLEELVGTSQPGAAGAPQAVGSGELFASMPAPSPAAGAAGSLFDQLGAITGGAQPKQAAPSAAAPAQPAAKAAACPTCNSTNIRVVFCPYCGAGMCANCSSNVRVEGDNLIYVCPKCKEDVTVHQK